MTAKKDKDEDEINMMMYMDEILIFTTQYILVM